MIFKYEIKKMKKSLSVSHYYFHLRFSLFLTILIICSTSLYFLIYVQFTSLIIGIGLSAIFIPWSFFYAIMKKDEANKQFQKVTFLEEAILFENLPLQGGVKIKMQIAYRNIKSVKIGKEGLFMLFVPRFEWVGPECTYITPSGYVPKLQVFSWKLVSSAKKQAILTVLEEKGIPME